MKEYKINVEALNAVLPATNKKEMGYFWLKGVFVEDKDGFRNYTATDGHILFTVKDKIYGDSLEKPLILEIKKPIKCRNAVGEMQVVDDETVVIKTNQEKVAVDIIDGTFPEYERVIPSEDTQKASEFALFDPDLLKKVYDFLGVKCKVPLMENANTAALYIVGNKRAVLMPMKENR